jgi:Zn-finger nucleic acid-binding protein
MRQAGAGERAFHACGKCGGLWLGSALVARLTKARDPELEDLARRAVPIVMHPVRDRRPLVSCPVCAKAMRRADIANSVNALDICDAHGTWFDPSELKAFAEASAEARAGDVDEGDLEAAGIGGGFFSRLFRKVPSGD